MNRNKPKNLLHPRNPHQGRYDLDALCKSCPELTAFIKPNPTGDNTIDFGDSQAVMSLNKALLAHFYKVKFWQLPQGYLCPPIPGRADYIHYLADLLADGGEVPRGKNVAVLDIGTGANCIYPIVGSQSYGWRFVGTDIDPISVNVAQLIVQSNGCLNKAIEIRLQHNSEHIFDGVVQANDYFDLTLCNPPFYGSMQEAQDSHERKLKNLGKPLDNMTRNFGGQKTELWCSGGEIAFISQMVEQSVQYAKQVGWFSSLVSKADNVPILKSLLKRLGAKSVRVIKMCQGQKVSRLIAWQF
jgi:23S rRNA (adenine1618-N6)-methyltransferase